MAQVKNLTAQAEAGGILAADFRRELAGRGKLDDAPTAPELAIELLGFRSIPTASGGEGAAAFRLEADLHIKAGSYEDRVTLGEDYLAGIDVLGTEANRRAAFRRLSRALARESIERYDVAGRF